MPDIDLRTRADQGTRDAQPAPAGEKSSRYSGDARRVIEGAVNNQDLSSFQKELQGMAPADRLEFVRALNAEAKRYSRDSARGENAIEGKKDDFVIVESTTDKRTGALLDLDIAVQPKFTGAVQRKDLFDPKDGSGKEVDALQQGRRDAGPYKWMDEIVRTDAVESNPYYRPDPKSNPRNSQRFDDLMNRMSAGISDPDRRARAQDYMNGNEKGWQKYNIDSSSIMPQEFTLDQLPADLRDEAVRTQRRNENRDQKPQRYRGVA